MKASIKKEHQGILEAIQKSGGRITKVRTRIVQMFAAAKMPISIPEISSQLQIDEVSVYRTIAYFKENKFIEEIVLPSGMRTFALITEHHDHVVCKKCGHTEHIPCTQKKSLTLPTHKNFAVVQEHQLTYYGVCTKCSV